MFILLILFSVLVILGLALYIYKQTKIEESDKNHKKDSAVKRNIEKDNIANKKLVVKELDKNKDISKPLDKPKIFNTTVVDPNYNPLVIKVRPKVLTYDDLLKDERWKAKALKIKQRDNFCCRYCRSILNLQVHHKYYSKYPDGTKVMPWNYPDDALITLCEYCHKRVHQTKKIKIYYRKYTDNY